MLVTSQSQTRRLDTLSKHAEVQPSYPSMQMPNHKPRKLDMLSQQAVETNHKSGRPDTVSLHAQHKQAIPACIVKYTLYKRG